MVTILPPSGRWFAGLLDEEEGRFRVDVETAVVVVFGDFQDRLLDDQTGGIDRDVRATEMLHGALEQFDVVAHHRQIALEQDGIGTAGLQLGGGALCVRAGGIAVVVDGDAGGARFRELAGNQGAQILAATGDHGDLALQGMTHEVLQE